MCDECWTFNNVVRVQRDQESFDLFYNDHRSHVQAATEMKDEYRGDRELSIEGKVNCISFDYAQNITLPHSALQPAKWYFFLLKNVYCFGIVDERLQKQTNYSYGEEVMGKGSKEVVSQIDFYLGGKRFDARTPLVLHADNCAGQNKNNLMLFYLSNLVEQGMFHKLTLKFQIKGHIRNACDQSFGLFKQKFVLRESFTEEHLLDIFNHISNLEAISFPSSKFYDWQVLETRYNKFPSLSKYQIFEFCSSRIGSVTV